MFLKIRLDGLTGKYGKSGSGKGVFVMKLQKITKFLLAFLFGGIGVGMLISGFNREMGTNVLLGTFAILFGVAVIQLLAEAAPYLATPTRLLAPIGAFAGTCAFLWHIYWPWATNLFPKWQAANPGLGPTFVLVSSYVVLMLGTMPVAWYCWDRRKTKCRPNDPRWWETRGHRETPELRSRPH